MSRSVSGLVLLAGGLVAGCSPSDTMTIEEAEQRAEDYARQALDLLPAYARTEADVSEISGAGCGDLSGNNGQENATLSYQIHGMRVSEYPKYFHRLEQWWHDTGFDDQIEDDRPRRESILAYHSGYQMGLHYENGELLLFTSSPCVYPDGTPE